MKRFSLGIAALAGLALAVSIAGCASYRGARLYRAGSAALERGEIASAVESLERAAALVPHASEIQNHLGLAYQAAGRREEALRAFRRSVALDCDNRPAAHNLALAERGDPDATP
ncbi:MAG: tetratricopeptide repeat protein [Myxococcales bacterium]|nr:tetratricopeptide repeat protein [Myxococcales bacterium]MDH5568021.1 tetratricopeptide repeat protein [Myxococcales bacterium]